MANQTKMKIVTQDKKKIVDMPPELWISDCFGYSMIVGKCYITPHLGIYGKQKAQEVLEEIIENYEQGTRVYYMPPDMEG